MFVWNLDSCRMNRILLLQVATALLVLSEQQHMLHKGKPGCSLNPNNQLSRVDMSTSTISSF